LAVALLYPTIIHRSVKQRISVKLQLLNKQSVLKQPITIKITVKERNYKIHLNQIIRCLSHEAAVSSLCCDSCYTTGVHCACVTCYSSQATESNYTTETHRRSAALVRMVYHVSLLVVTMCGLQG